MTLISDKDQQGMSIRSLCIIALTLGTISVGCSVQKTTGKVVSEYAVEHLIPYVIATEDLDMACEMGSSMGPFLLSFGRVGAEIDRSATPTFMTAAMCSEKEVWEEELREARAERTQQATELRDAFIARRRAHGITAARYYLAYQHMKKVFGEGCDKLDGEEDEFVMLLGLMGGLLAVQHDRASGVVVNVPTDIPIKVSRQTKCLSDQTWWGVPSALRTAVWISVPGSAPADIKEKDKSLFEYFTPSLELADQSGVRLAYSIYILAALASGKSPKAIEGIKAFAKSFDTKPSHPKWKMLDLSAYAQIQAVSDRLLTQKRGFRTQHDLGTFSDWSEDVSSSDSGDDDDGDDLLDELGDE